MGVFFRTVRVYLTNLGLFVAGIFGAVFAVLFYLPKKAVPYLKKTFSSARLFLKRAAVFVLIAALVTGSLWLALSTGEQKKAVELKLNGETVGWAETKAEAEQARTAALSAMGVTNADGVEIAEGRTLACNLKSAATLSQLLQRALSTGRVTVCEVVVDGIVLCALEDEDVVRSVLNDKLDRAAAAYPDSTVSFSETVALRTASYEADDERIWSPERFKLAVGTLDAITVQHVACEKTVSPLAYDTVELQTNTLFIGDSRVRREGRDGQEYVVDLVTYVGQNKVLSKQLMSVTVLQPVSRVVERGMRAGSLTTSQGYTVTQTTGVFAWPVVGLNTVTSLFGPRSLGYHHGLDISGANAAGSLVVAAAGGTVVEAGWNTGGLGNYVQIDHGNGIETLYAHMQNNSLMVSVGDVVTKGQALGRVGNTGYSFGAHLHFGVLINGTVVDPAPYLGL